MYLRTIEPPGPIELVPADSDNWPLVPPDTELPEVIAMEPELPTIAVGVESIIFPVDLLELEPDAKSTLPPTPVTELPPVTEF